MYSRRSLAIALVLISLGFVSGCGGKSWTKLSVKEMRSILVEVSLASATFEQAHIADSIRQISYQEVFDRHHITQADWDSSMAWYSKNKIEEFNLIHQSVRDSLQRVLEQLNKLNTERNERANYLASVRAGSVDSVNFLKTPVHYWSSNGEYINEYFNFSPTANYTATHRLVYTLRLSGMPRLKKDLQMRLALHFTDSTSLTKVVPIKKSGLYRIELNIPDNKSAARITGYLRGFLPKLQPARVFALDSVSLVRLPSLRTVSAGSGQTTEDGFTTTGVQMELIDSTVTINNPDAL